MYRQLHRYRRSLGLAAALSLGASALAQSDALRPGFAQTASRTLAFAQDACRFTGATALPLEATLSDGRIVQFTGQDFLLLAPDGTLRTSLGALPEVVFPSFVVVDPSETFAVVGESCNGDVFRVDLAGGGFSTVARLAFNYDAAFTATPDVLLVSASATSPFGRNQIWRVDLNSGATTLRGRLAGFSGPVLIDAAGDLYYATQRSGQAVEIVKWDAAFLNTGALLTDDNATPVAGGFASGSDLAYDPVADNLLLTEYAALRILSTTGEELGLIATSGSNTFFANVEVHHGGSTGSLQAFQPANSVLRYTATDFFSFGERRTAAPARPVATLSGATSGPATKTLTIEGAHPNATVLVYFNDVSFLDPNEYVFDQGFPFHTALAPNRSRRIRPPLATDASGTATFTYHDPGSLHGTLVFQAAVFDGFGNLVGTSTYALN